LNFNGGVIFPGIATMISSLNHSKAKISVEQQPIADTFVDLQNKNTTLAVSNGIYHCVISAIDRAIEYHSGLDHSGFKTIITGGDASRIEHLSQYNMQIVSELVFIGIQALSEEQEH
jgi:pantothenate kinase type III